MPQQLIFLVRKIDWFGAHSGYECLVNQVQRFFPASEIESVSPRNALLDRMRGKLVSTYHGLGKGPQGFIAAVHRFSRRLERNPKAIGHVLYGEDVLPYINLFSAAALERLVVTVHQPRSLWTAQMHAALSRVRHVLALYSRDLEYLGSTAKRPATLLLHGADLEFFKPNEERRASEPRLLYSGVHLRSPEMLHEVVGILRSRGRQFGLEFLVPKDHPTRTKLEQLFAGESVTWLCGLDDEHLLQLYQFSTLMLLPLTDSGANTAVVEALACGLPLVTTNVGGISDYGGGTVFPTVELMDSEGMADLVCAYLDNETLRSETSKRMRRFAVEHLDWAMSARQHLSFYDSLR